MLATLIDVPFDKEGWSYELKWDGYRALAFMNKNTIELRSRNEKSFNDKFYPIIPALKAWGINAVIDGEVVVLDESGKSVFGDLQNWRSDADGELVYYVFDICWYDGKALTGLPLSERREILASIVPDSSIIRYSEDYRGSGIDFFREAGKLGLEGIIAKKLNSRYHGGERVKDWLKLKANKSQEVVIGGYTKNHDSSRPFSSLLVGVYEKGKLRYTGKVGTGFNVAKQRELLKNFSEIKSDHSPFMVMPDVNKPSRFRPDPPQADAFFLKPELVCEVSYSEFTRDGIMRHPSFKGLRTDKKASEVKKEKEQATKKVVGKTSVKSELLKPVTTRSRKTLLNPTDETQVRKVKGKELKFTNLSKIFWPAEKLTKRDLINYYYQVAPYIMPYLKERPQSMNRHPNGIKGESFYYKDVTGRAPEWAKTYPYTSESDHRKRQYLVADDEASLLYMASLGCIEMNPWHSRVGSEDYPDWCVIDLDPGKRTFEEVIIAAQETKNVLDELNVPGYPKTSGSTGIHIYIPLGANYTYDQSKEFARIIVKLVNERVPEFTTLERVVKKRRGKMYLDFLQNRAQATISAPYSIRPKPGAPVSMPLHWDEVKKGLKMTDFNIRNAFERIRSEGDIFKPVLGKGIRMEKILERFLKE